MGFQSGCSLFALRSVASSTYQKEAIKEPIDTTKEQGNTGSGNERGELVVIYLIFIIIT